MLTRTEKTALVDGLLKMVAVGGITFTAIAAPNALQALDKPLRKYFDKLDDRSRTRELNHALRYMQRQGLVSGNYEHGLKITNKAKRRLEKRDLDSLLIPRPRRWDKQWRLILYDIPENKKMARNFIALRFRLLGCQQLQRSVWIHPFPCEQEINAIVHAAGVARYVTYIEVGYINNRNALIERFRHLGIY